MLIVCNVLEINFKEVFSKKVKVSSRTCCLSQWCSHCHGSPELSPSEAVTEMNSCHQDSVHPRWWNLWLRKRWSPPRGSWMCPGAFCPSLLWRSHGLCTDVVPLLFPWGLAQDACHLTWFFSPLPLPPLSRNFSSSSPASCCLTFDRSL